MMIKLQLPFFMSDSNSFNIHTFLNYLLVYHLQWNGQNNCNEFNLRNLKNS